MPRAHVLSGDDLAAWRAAYDAGDAPAALPYGVDALESAGYCLTASGRSGGRVIRKLRDVVDHRFDMSLQPSLAGIADVARADVVVAFLEGEGVAPAWLRRHHVPPFSRTPVLVVTCWLADDASRAGREEREALRRRFEGADLLTHMSRHETEILVDLGIPEERLFPMTFGVSADYYVPGEVERDIPLLAVGQDRGRDYRTLLDAIRGTDLHLDLVCKPQNLDGLDIPDNVRVRQPVPHSEYRRLLQRAQVVVVPTRVMAYPTGQSVALEAASSGCCVVVTDTPAMSDYIHAEKTGVLVPPGDVEGWRNALTGLRDDPARRERLGSDARRSVETRFNTQNMWRAVGEAIIERGLV